MFKGQQYMTQQQKALAEQFESSIEAEYALYRFRTLIILQQPIEFT